MSLVKETGSCALDNGPDKTKAQPVTANPQTIDATTVRLVKFPPHFDTRNLRAMIVVE